MRTARAHQEQLGRRPVQARLVTLEDLKVIYWGGGWFGVKQRLAFALGAMLAALFPLLYVALIPLVAWALCWFGSASDTTSKVHSPIVAASVLLVGCLLILSLLKPLVARPAATSEPHYLNPERQLLLFALVRSLASNIGVTAPERVAVDCNVNCYCMFAGGITGVFRSGFVLVIGLPLVAGLRLDQVVGVVAHELGHALQITTMHSAASSGWYTPGFPAAHPSRTNSTKCSKDGSIQPATPCDQVCA